MKKSIVFAFIILLITVGWLASGQFGQVNAEDEKITQNSAKTILPEFERMSNILGIQIMRITNEEKNEINQMIKKRDEYRIEKNYERADKIRDEISGKNIIFIDHKNRTTWVKQEKIKAE